MAGDSHNDFVHLLIEEGILGLLSALLLLKGIARWAGARGTPVVLCIVITASLSNGLLSRPPQFFFFAPGPALKGSQGGKFLRPDAGCT